MEAWLALFGLSLGATFAWSTVRRSAMPRQESALTIALTVAALEAARREHGPVTAAHLAHAAMFAYERENGPDLVRVRDAIDVHLDTLPVRAEVLVEGKVVAPSHEAPLGREVMAAIQAAAVAADFEMRTLSLRAVLERLRGEVFVRALLDAIDAPPKSQPRDLVGAPYRAATSEDRVVVRLRNDESSTMEGVLVVLRESFAKGNAEALHLMLTTHYEGSAIVGRYAHAEAESLKKHATQRARDLGMPLVIDVDLPGAPAPRPPTFAERLVRLFNPRPFP